MIACSLTEDELQERRARWDALRAHAEMEIVRTERGLQLAFRAEPGIADELETLVSLERDCCGFAAWSVRTDGDRLVLDVTGHGHPAVAAVQGMFGGGSR